MNRVALLVLMVGALVPACSADCSDSVAEYPPPAIRIEGVDVPWTAWQCVGYNADTMDGPTTIEVSGDGLVEIEVPLDDGALVEVRANLADEQVTLAAERDLSYRLPDGATSLDVSVCTEDDRCGFYRPELG